MSINKAIICGRLTADVEVRYTASGKARTHFTIAVNNGKEVKSDFIRCIAWEKTAEFMAKHLARGRKLIAEGALKSYSYESDGNNIYGMELLVTKVEFADGKPEGGESNTCFDGEKQSATAQDVPF